MDLFFVHHVHAISYNYFRKSDFYSWKSHLIFFCFAKISFHNVQTNTKAVDFNWSFLRLYILECKELRSRLVVWRWGAPVNTFKFSRPNQKSWGHPFGWTTIWATRGEKENFIGLNGTKRRKLRTNRITMESEII